MSGVAVATRRRDDVDIERDRELVERAQSGDADAFGDLYLRYFDRLCRFCYRRLGNMSEAEDSAQEAFTKAWKALPRFDGERRLYPWLSVIAANVCTDLVRRRSRSKVVDEPDLERVAAPVEGGQEEIVERADNDLLNVALARISPRHREVLRLRESYEWSYQRIAAYQGVEVSTIETLLFRARRSLRREFMALAEAQGALAGAVLIALRRGLWRARHFGAPAGAAKSAVPAVAGAGAGGTGGAVISAGAVAALFAIGLMAGSATIVRHLPARPAGAGQASTQAGQRHGSSSTGAASQSAGLGSSAGGSGLATASAGGSSRSASSTATPGLRVAGAVTSAKGRLGGATSTLGSQVQTAGNSLSQATSAAVKTVTGVVGAAGGVVQSVLGTVTHVASPTTTAPPVTLPPVTVPPVTVPPVTVPAVSTTLPPLP